MEQEIAARDDYDSSRAVAPLKAAGDAVVLDTTELDIEQVVSRVAEIINQMEITNCHPERSEGSADIAPPRGSE
jgi:cytidylate kinase